VNWAELLRRCWIVIAFASISFSIFVGWQNTENVYAARAANGAWEIADRNCISGTFAPVDISGPPEVDENYRYAGECRTADAIVAAVIVGMIFPAVLLLIYFILRWVFRGLYADRRHNKVSVNAKDAVD